MTRRFPLLLPLIGLLMLVPALATAQPGISNQIERELERTDLILDRARDQVGVSITSHAEDLLRQARDLQQKAWGAFRRESASYQRQALELTLKARDLAQRAIETAELEAQAYEKTRDLVESTKDLIETANLEIRDSGDAQAIRLLEGGIWQLQKAREAYRSREYRQAIRLAGAAHDLVERALQRARSAPASGRLQIESALEQTGSLLDEVRERLGRSPRPKAEKLFEQATALQTRAWRHFRDNRDDLAVRLAKQARQFATDALLLLTQDLDRRDVEQALGRIDRTIRDLTPKIRASGSERAERLLSSARERYQEGMGQMQRGRYAKALESARLADGFLRRAAEVAGLR